MIKFFIHIIIVFSIFLSSSGFWINSHYCQGKKVGNSFGSYHEEVISDPCAGEMSCSKGNHEEEDDNCCHSEPSYHKLDQTQRLEEIEFKSFEQSIVLGAAVPAIFTELPLLDGHTFQYFNYKPPPIIFDRQVWLQTYLC